MTRTIKFRAWDREAKEYYYDVEYTYDFRCSGRGCYADSFGDILAHPERYEVEQYTGVKDKNGKEIYEGDIVKFGDSIAVIIWRNKRAEFGVRWTDCGIEDSLSWQVETEKTISEVIGNTHENPELLGGEE